MAIEKKMPLEWELDARETMWMFEAVADHYGEAILKLQQKRLLVASPAYRVQPFAIHDGEPQYYNHDRLSTQDRLIEIDASIAKAEKIRNFALKVKDQVSRIDIQNEVQKMADAGFFDSLFGRKKKK